MTTSLLFAYYTLDSQVSLSSCMSIKTGLFFFFFFFLFVSLPRFLLLQIIIVSWKIFKKSVENKNKLRTIYPKNNENFKNNKPSVQFIGSYKKRVYLQKSHNRKKNEKLISIDFQIAHVVSDYLSISDFTERHFKTYAEANSSHSQDNLTLSCIML